MEAFWGILSTDQRSGFCETSQNCFTNEAPLHTCVQFNFLLQCKCSSIRTPEALDIEVDIVFRTKDSRFMAKNTIFIICCDIFIKNEV